MKKNHPEKLCHLLYDQLHVGSGAVFVFNEALGQVVQLQDESRSRVNVVSYRFSELFKIVINEKWVWNINRKMAKQLKQKNRKVTSRGIGSSFCFQ